MNASAAIAHSRLRQACKRLARHAGGRARRSVGQRTAQVRFPPSQIHAPVSLRDCAISRRTIMNNVGSNQLGLRIFPPDIFATRLCPDLCRPQCPARVPWDPGHHHASSRHEPVMDRDGDGDDCRPGCASHAGHVHAHLVPIQLVPAISSFLPSCGHTGRRWSAHAVRSVGTARAVWWP